MKPHLKEQEILDRLFGLAEPADADRIDRHLAECADCRKHSELLSRRFASLEWLRDEEPASERLIADTLRRVRTDRPARETRFPSWAWLTGAAAAAAVLLALFVVAPRTGRPPAMELARSETAAAPAGGGAPESQPTPFPEPSAAPPPVEPPAGALLAEDSPMIGAESVDREETLRAAGEVLSGAAGQPAAPALAVARGISAGGLPYAEFDEVPAPKTAAPVKEKRPARRPRKPRPADAAPYTARLPRGWSFDPTNQVRVMLIPLKSKADGLIAPPAEGFRTRHWQIRVLNDATNAQLVSVARAFERPGWDLQLLNDEGRLARRSDLEAVIEANVPAGGVRAVHCMISEPEKEKTP